MEELRIEYLKTKSKRGRGLLLNEAERRTKLNRKYLMEKLKPKSNLDKLPGERKKRKQYYDNYVKAALARQYSNNLLEKTKKGLQARRIFPSLIKIR